MDAKRILSFLRQVTANNNRPWFQEHKAEYDAVKAEFERGIAQAIERIMTFDPEIAHLKVKDCTYRFYRDTRFSADKSPYKNHMGAYIDAKGKKALRGGYYLHLEPDHCLVAVGNYWLPRQSGYEQHQGTHEHQQLGPATGFRAGETEDLSVGLPQGLALRALSPSERLLCLACCA